MPPGLDIDGEPFIPHNPVPAPSRTEIAQARFDATTEAIARRDAETAERDALRTALLAKRFNRNT
jgi:hypothetical protein